MRILLLLFIFSFSAMAQQRPAMRKVDERIKQLKELNSNHCAQFGEYEQKCRKDFDHKMMKRIRDLNSVIVVDKDKKAIEDINAVIAEEQAVKKYRDILTKLGIPYSQNDDSDALEQKYRDYQEQQRELECIANRQNYIDQNCSGVVSYNGSETCAELEYALSEANYCPGSGSGSGGQ